MSSSGAHGVEVVELWLILVEIKVGDSVACAALDRHQVIRQSCLLLGVIATQVDLHTGGVAGHQHELGGRQRAHAGMRCEA